jgi:hypothetical protein
MQAGGDPSRAPASGYVVCGCSTSLSWMVRRPLPGTDEGAGAGAALPCLGSMRGLGGTICSLYLCVCMHAQYA